VCQQDLLLLRGGHQAKLRHSRTLIAVTDISHGARPTFSGKRRPRAEIQKLQPRGNR
jgi:hypothetical protein